MDVDRESHLVLALLVGHDDRVLAGVRLAAVGNFERDFVSGFRDPELSGLLGDRLPVLHPGDGFGQLVQLCIEGGLEAAVEGQRFREGFEPGSAHGRLSRHDDDQGAGGEALADVVEGLAGVSSGVFREDFLNLESVDVAAPVDVGKVLAGLDLLLVVKPHDVELGRAGDGTLKLDRRAVGHDERLDVFVDPRRRGGECRGLGAVAGQRHDLDVAGGFDGALGVGGLAGVASGVLRVDLVDDDGGDAVLVLDLHDVVGVQLSAVLRPDNLRIGITLDGHPQLEPGAILDLHFGVQPG